MIERQLSEIRAAVNTQRITTGIISNNPPRMRLAQLQGELTQLSTVYTDKYPDIISSRMKYLNLSLRLRREKVRIRECLIRKGSVFNR